MARNPFSPPKPSQKSNNFFQVPTEALKIADGTGAEVKYRILTTPTQWMQYHYPCYDVAASANKRGVFNLTDRWYVKNSTGSDVERNMITLDQELLERRRAAAKERMTGKFDDTHIEKEIKKIKSPFPNVYKFAFGEQQNAYGFQAFYNGDIVATHVKATSYDPLTVKDPEKQEFSTGIIQLLEQAYQGKQVYTPFVSLLTLTSKQSKKKFGANHYLVWEPTMKVHDEYKSVLNAGYWIFVHPGDEDIVQGFIEDLNAGRDPEVPDYRNYPNEEGDLVYMSPDHQSVKLNVVNDKTGITVEMVEKMKKAPRIFNYEPSTEHSLLGGYYYQKGSARVPITDTEITLAKTGNFDIQGNPEIDIKGVLYHALWLDGVLWRKPFDPEALDSNSEYAFSDEVEREWLQTRAEQLGIPTYKCYKAGKMPKPTTFTASVNQTATNAVTDPTVPDTSVNGTDTTVTSTVSMN